MIWGVFSLDYNENHNPDNGQFAESPTTDVTDEYLENARQGEGTISFESGYKRTESGGEEEFAQFIHDTLGGDITHLAVSSVDGVQTPDYIWRGKLWELKGVSSLNAVDRQLQDGLRQTFSNPGGIMINCKGNFASLNEIVSTINNRLQRSSKKQVDVIIVMDGEIKKILREKEKKNPQT